MPCSQGSQAWLFDTYEIQAKRGDDAKMKETAASCRDVGLDAGSPFSFLFESIMASKRELIDTGTDKRYVRRGRRGRFKESDDVGRSLVADRRTNAKRTVKSGQGDKGDQKRNGAKSRARRKKR